MAVLLAASGSAASAQNSIVPDSSLTTPTVVTRSDAGGKTTYDITGGTPRNSGQLLFHSFSVFGLRPHETGNFLNGSGVATIFSRVTGGTPSQIDGLIKASGSANLYLINPQGIIFGTSGAIQVGGSFIATTASSLTFGDKVFAAVGTIGDAPLITSNVTPGLQFGSGSAQLQVAGMLKVEAGKNIILAGGSADRVEVSGSLQAPGGLIDIKGGTTIVNAGTISANQGGKISVKAALATTIRASSLSASNGKIHIEGGSVYVGSRTGRTILLAGSGSLIANESLDTNLTLLDGGSGTSGISIQGGTNNIVQIFSGATAPFLPQGITTLRGATAVNNASAADPSTPAISQIVVGGVQAGTSPVATSHTTTVGSGSSLTANAGRIAVVSSGDTTINTGTLTANQGGAIVVSGTTTTNLSGATLSALKGTGTTGGTIGISGGDVTIGAASGRTILRAGNAVEADAAQNFTLLDGGSGSASAIHVTGGAGQPVQIFSGDGSNTSTTSLRGATTVTAGKTESPGRIVVGGLAASTDGVETKSMTTTVGSGTTLTANAGRIDVVSNGNTTSSAKLSADQGGAIAVNGSSAAELSGGSLQAEGGSISISGSNVTNLGNTTLTANPFKSSLGTKTGRIVVGGGLSGSTVTPTSKTTVIGSSSSLTANDGGGIDVVSTGSTTSSGTITANQGSINLNGPALTISGGTLDAAGGSVSLNGSATVINAGKLTANQGGVISINGAANVLMNNSKLNTETSSGGLGGDIKISGSTVTIKNDSLISSQTTAAGNGGQINLNANTINLDTGSTITTQTTGSGRGASVLVEGNTIVLDTGSKITTQAGIFNPDGSPGPATASGPAGTITITAAGPNSLHILNSSAISASTNSSQPYRDPADLGGIVIRTPYLELNGSGTISTNAFSAAQGGNMKIDAARVDLNNGSRISAVGSGTGPAGTIDLSISQNLSLCNRCSINTSTSAFAALPTEGNITLKVGGNLLLLGNSSITAAASGFATGGSINIWVGGDLVRSPNSIINTSAIGFANSGKVFINIPNGSLRIANNLLSASCFELDSVVRPDVLSSLYAPFLVPGSDSSSTAVDQAIINPSNVVDQSCSPRVDRSSFQTCGRGGVPSLPGASPGRRPLLDDLGPPAPAPQSKAVPVTRSSLR